MIQYTTYDVQLKVSNPDIFNGLTSLYVTLKQNSEIILTKNIDLETLDISQGIIPLSLSQEETSSFGIGYAELQVNFLYDNIRKASNIKKIYITENLITEVL